MALIYIPLHRSEEYVELPVDSLMTTDPRDLLHMLMREKVPLEIWLKIAVEYYKLGREEAYEAIMNVAVGQKPRNRVLPPLTPSSLQVLTPDEEMRLSSEWHRIKMSSDYVTGVGVGALYDSLAALYLKAATDPLHFSTDQSSLSEKDKDKKRRDLQNVVTTCLQQAEQLEKTRFQGDSSEWLSKLVSGLQYFSKSDNTKALASFKASLAMYESRAARLGVALVLMKTGENLLALQEMSRVYLSLHAAHLEPLGAYDPETGVLDETVPSRMINSESGWFKAQRATLKSAYHVNNELLSTYIGLRPAMAIVWSRLGGHDRAIEILKTHVKFVKDSYDSGQLQSKAGLDRSLAILGTLLVNKYGEGISKAKSEADVEVATESLTAALSYLKEGFGVNPNNPNILNQLSNLFFTQKAPHERDYSRIDSFARKAKEVAQNAGWKEIEAESSFHLARSLHARGEYASALPLYSHALTLWPGFPLPLFAMGQLALHKPDVNLALEYFTKLDNRFPDLPETKAILGHLHASIAYNIHNGLVTPSGSNSTNNSSNISSNFQDHFTKASKYLTRALQLDPNNFTAILDLAQLKERFSPVESLNAYLQASDSLFREWITESGLTELEYNQLAKEMMLSEGQAATQMSMEDEVLSLPAFIKKINLINPRLVWNNLSVMRMELDQLKEAREGLLKVILLGASTLNSHDASSVSSLTADTRSSSRKLSFVHPTSYASLVKPTERSKDTTWSSLDRNGNFSNHLNLSSRLIFKALFAKPFREPLTEDELNEVERFVVESGVYLLPLNVSAAYNLALVFEKSRRVNDALELYLNIAEKYPEYLDAQLRMGMLKRDIGKLDEAEKILRALESGTSTTSDANIKMEQSQVRALGGVVLANMLMGKKEYTEAKSLLDRLVNNLNKSDYNQTQKQLTLQQPLNTDKAWSHGSDLYALTQYANFFLTTAYASPNRDKNLKWATDLFTTVLKQSPGNIYAANGLAIISAMKIESNEKLQIVPNSNQPSTGSSPSSTTSNQSSNQVVMMTIGMRKAMSAWMALREAVPGLVDLQINLGHLSFAAGDYRASTKHYQAVWNKYGATSPVVREGQVASMLARSMKEMGLFAAAKRILEQALHFTPHDNDLWYNLAVLCKEYGLDILKRVSDYSEELQKEQELVDESKNRSKNLMDLDELPGSSNNRHTHDTDSTTKIDEVTGIDDGLLDSILDTNEKSLKSSSTPTKAASTPTKGNSTTPNKAKKVVLSSPSESEQEAAISVLLFAGPLFERLTNPIGKHTFSTKKCSKFAKLCEMNRELAEEKLSAYRNEMTRLKTLKEARLKEALDEEATIQAQLAALEAEEKVKLEELNVAAEEARLKSQALLSEWAESRPDDEKSGRKKSSSSSKRRSKRSQVDSDSDSDDIMGTSSFSKLPEEEEEGLEGPIDDDDDQETSGSRPKTRASSTTTNTEVNVDPAVAADTKRKSELEAMAEKRNALKRKRDGITPAPPVENTDKKLDDAAPADENDADETGDSSQSAKRKKVRETKSSQDDDESDLPGLDE